MFQKYLQNTRKPGDNIVGQMMLSGMNMGHKPLYDFGLKHINFNGAKEILDLGCGGGKIIQRELRLAPGAKVSGLDYSPASVKRTLSLNRKAVKTGRCEVVEGDVTNVPFEKDRFDVITAFETVYFWKPVEKAFAEVYRVTKIGGRFYVVCETGDPQKGEKWAKIIGGMTVYTKEQMNGFMLQAGFSDINFSTNKDMVCVSGLKK